MNIFDIIVDALEFNEGVDFVNILACAGLYWLFFWFSISVWVFLDARKRYENPRIALLWAFVVFFLFFPALIFYLAVRKSEDPLELDLYEEAGGVNVPLVNFTGNEGMQMTLELNIEKMPASAQRSDMEVDVRWKSKQDKMKLIEKIKEDKKEKKSEMKESKFILRLKRKVKSIIDNFKKKRVEKKKKKKSEKKIKIEMAKKKIKSEKGSKKEKEIKQIEKEKIEEENKDNDNKEEKEKTNQKEEEMKKQKDEEKIEKSEKNEHQNKKQEEGHEHKENKNDD